ncbi:MAG TPA: UDP-N-acetylmuramoyl-L-alanine--D-glutamate ligase [candidate division Zixibacteria bacterium]|nr:UDP-N-acetylmuramoyl-L-alanine--D-glutamate ligase [candidate division Zixibacteria bacterium]
MTTRTPLPTSTADLAGRRVVVLGLARSGLAAARMLARVGAEVTAYDRRSAEELGAALGALGGLPVRAVPGASPEEVERLLAGADLVVTSPSISARFPTTDPWLREALRRTEAEGVPVMGEVDLFLSLTRARVLAVTGTKGKTTTVALLGSILAASGLPHAVGGNIGTPLIERVDELGTDHWVALELSELQLPTIPRGADVAVYTNIAADHLDRHGTVEAYRAVKARLAELTVARRAPVVLNADDPGCVALGERLEGGLRWYGLGRPELAATADEVTVLLDGESLLARDEVPLPGRHMLANVLAAVLGAAVAGVPRHAIAEGVRTFRGVPHRLETVATVGGVRYVNDSQATIPMATLAALEAFDDAPLVLIAGGRGKGLEFAGLADAVAARCRAAVLIGEMADELERLLAGRVPVWRAQSMQEAVRLASGAAEPDGVVLLSPAAASFDMFADYAARGDAFRAAVHALQGGRP